MYNRCLHRWRKAEITDEDAVAELEALRHSQPDEWTRDYLLALVQLERGDDAAARALLEEAQLAAPEARHVVEALARARGEQGVRCVRELEGHTDAANSVALSADGRLALSGGRDGTVRLWELDSGRCLHAFQGHTDCVFTVALSSDGRLALSDGRYDAVRVWELDSGRCLRTLGRTWERAVGFSADGRLALSTHPDKEVSLWEVDSGRRLHTLNWHEVEGSAALPGAMVVTDGWQGYAGVAKAGYGHARISIRASTQTASHLLPRVHRVAALLKRWLLSTHHGAVQPDQLDYYLDEFTFRFNRRDSRARGLLFYRLLHQAVHTPPQPYGTIATGPRAVEPRPNHPYPRIRRASPDADPRESVAV